MPGHYRLSFLNLPGVDIIHKVFERVQLGIGIFFVKIRS